MATENAKLAALLQRLQEHHDKGGALLEELTALVQAEETPGQVAKRVLDFFCKHWARKYPGQTYVVNGGKDIASLKRVLKTLPPDQVAARVRAYFRSDSVFFANAGHSLPVFVASINSLSGAAITAADQLHIEAQKTRERLDKLAGRA